MISEAEPIALTGIVVEEILQRLVRKARAIERFLFQWPLL